MKVHVDSLEELRRGRVYTSKHWDKNYGRTIPCYLINDEFYYLSSWMEGSGTQEVMMRRCKDEWYLIGSRNSLTIAQWRNKK